MADARCNHCKIQVNKFKDKRPKDIVRPRERKDKFDHKDIKAQYSPSNRMEPEEDTKRKSKNRSPAVAYKFLLRKIIGIFV